MALSASADLKKSTTERALAVAATHAQSSIAKILFIKSSFISVQI
jgi:hypothetical protein